ncbi:hypothetical protein [Bradyrhizobium sp. AUGA SZCCT0182]|uniref:hypothetical protein n=1 Tax=Bradyrhizobium sp. AUGA SZCCT0182 TaxID=2807667 RepID=UPI001BAA9B05|nr:hypothetical protein [Bradyrhizobium sp. AUGA SZCCT0182]MBR1238348.1 hypothetical protein [Bradyrhizobium sp. AUGA SZCCT0182]
MPKQFPAVVALALAGACLFASPARADDADRALLSTFCDAADIKESTCTRARNYPDAGNRECDVKLTSDRHSGRFIAAGNPLLVVNYESGCEPHATDNGGAVVFEQSGGKTIFRSFQPGSQVNNCVTLPKSAGQDWLMCITGHIGQGNLETGVAEFVFTQDYSRNVSISPDFLVTAVDSIRAYGANVVTCKERSKYFEISDIKAGPRPQTVTVTVSHADANTIRKACRKGFPKPKAIFGKLSRGEAYVPEGYEKRGKLIIDLVTRKVTPQG